MLERIKVGTAAGLAAGLSVAVMVLVYDIAKMEPLATPTALAGSVLGTPIELNTGLGTLDWIAGALHVGWGIIGYTAAHFLVFALVGVGAAFVFRSGLLPGNVLTGALYGALVGSGVFYLGLGLVAPQFISVPDWRLVMLVNAVAGVVLVSQLLDQPGEPVDAVA